MTSNKKKRFNGEGKRLSDQVEKSMRKYFKELDGEKATNIYKDLKKNNLDILIDDTDENLSSKIKKFNLLGIPYQIIIGKNFNEQKIEFKEIHKEPIFISLNEIINKIKSKKSN